MTYGLRISASVYIIYLSVPSPGATARVQNGVSGSYMDAVFKLVAHHESESWTSLYHIVLPRKAYYSSQVSRVYVPAV